MNTLIWKCLAVIAFCTLALAVPVPQDLGDDLSPVGVPVSMPHDYFVLRHFFIMRPFNEAHNTIGNPLVNKSKPEQNRKFDYMAIGSSLDSDRMHAINKPTTPKNQSTKV